MWALLSEKLFRGQLPAGVLMEGFALGFHFVKVLAENIKLLIEKKFNPSFYYHHDLQLCVLVSVFEYLKTIKFRCFKTKKKRRKIWRKNC